jgi:predicted DNA-binding protein
MQNQSTKKHYNKYNTIRSYRLSPVMAQNIDIKSKELGITHSEFIRMSITETIDRLQTNPLNTFQGGH